MATGTVLLPTTAAVLPDGSTSNLAPGMSRRQGTQTGAKVHFITLDFDGAGNLELCFFGFRLPANYASAAALKLQWQANATANAVKWQAKVGAVTPADADTVLEHAFATAATVTTNVNTTEARRLTESSIDLSGVFDSGAPGDYITIQLLRDSADAADTATVDAELLTASFEYTTT
jgi:hypothetical protein